MNHTLQPSRAEVPHRIAPVSMLTTDQLRSLRDALVALPAAYSQYDLDSNSRGIIIDVLGCSSGRARQVLYDLRAGEIITPARVPGGAKHQAESGRPALVRWTTVPALP